MNQFHYLGALGAGQGSQACAKQMVTDRFEHTRVIVDDTYVESGMAGLSAVRITLRRILA